jgi:hypothetical protein
MSKPIRRGTASNRPRTLERKLYCDSVPKSFSTSISLGSQPSRLKSSTASPRSRRRENESENKTLDYLDRFDRFFTDDAA